MNIEYLTYNNIDKQKWDDCIKRSINGLIYARSFYLDSMAANWDGLILGDYQAVMPLTWKTKWGIRYLYQPAFIQQGGIFYENEKDNQPKSFTSKAMEHFKFAEITLNYRNDASCLDGKAKISLRNNYVLNLARPYDDLYHNYHPAFTKSLRRIQKFEMHYQPSEDFRSAIHLYRELYNKRLPYFSREDFLHFENICNVLAGKNSVLTRSAYDAKGNLLATVVLLKDDKRLYNLISCITPAGKLLEANYFLYDKVLAEFCEHDLLLDMEGSDRKGIADFYKKLNPVNEPYPFIKYNNLNSFIKLFKQ